jgi:hypothetical protein
MSTTGYVFIATGGAITWRSRKQDITALLSTEAEYITLWEAGKDASWLRNLYHKLKFTQQKPMILMQDNTSTIAIALNSVFYQQTKHIDSRYHWVREKIQVERFDVVLCCTQDQTADVLTKALPCPKHERHTAEMGLSPV